MSDNLKEETSNIEEVLNKALSDLCQALNTFGCKEVLDLLVIHSHQDIIVHKLLERYPGIVALGEFLYRKPIYQVDRETLMATDFPIYKREKNGQEDDREIPSKIPKRGKIKKKKTGKGTSQRG